MSFTKRTKEELLKTGFGKIEEQLSEAYGFLLFSSQFNKNEIYFKSENQEITKRLFDLIKNISGVDGELFEKSGPKPYRFRILNSDAEKVFNLFRNNDKISLSVEADNIPPGTVKSFIKGVFFASGNIQDPEKGYRLEFVVKFMTLCISFIEFLSENDIMMSFSQRRDRYVVYTKDSAMIEDLLVLLGAHNSSLEIMNAKIYKDIRNRINRKTNFETANINKTVMSAEPDCEAIQYLLEHTEPEDLSEELTAAALLRIENPDLSLTELSKIAVPKVSRSGLYHRIKKLVSMSEQIKLREEG